MCVKPGLALSLSLPGEKEQPDKIHVPLCKVVQEWGSLLNSYRISHE